MNHFFRKVPGRRFPEVFRKKCSSGRRLETSGRTLLPETFRKTDAHYKLRVRGRGTNLFAEKKNKALARLAEKKLHGEEKKQVPGEEEAVPGEKKLCSGTGEKKNLFEKKCSGNDLRFL
ncbi:hypothetical protein HKD37_10G029360 [Glycine soja]